MGQFEGTLTMADLFENKSTKRHCGHHTKFWMSCYKITCLKLNYLGVLHLIVLHIYINKNCHIHILHDEGYLYKI